MMGTREAQSQQSVTRPTPARPRLLILNDHWGLLGGGEVVAAQLATALRERFEIAILTTGRGDESRDCWDGLPVYRLHSDYRPRLRPVLGLANPRLLAGVSRVLLDFRPQIVHAWNIHQHLSYASLALARRSGARTVLTFQDALPFCYTKFHCYIAREAPCPPQPTYGARPANCRSCRPHYWLFPPRNRLIRLLVSRFVDQKVSVSRALADALADNGLAGAQVIHNGLPLSAYPPPVEQVADAAERFGLGREAVVAGGRMGWFKGQHQLLEAFGRVASVRPAAQLVLAGRDDDWYVQQLKERAAALRLDQRVRFTGLLPHAQFRALLAAGALFANLSLYLDPFPTVNLETGAAGRPVLGTCFGGTPEVVLDGKTGRIVNPHHLGEVESALHSLLQNPADRERLGQAAAERVHGEFPLERMAAAYTRLFQSLASDA